MQESEVRSLLDPRTKLLLVVTIATVMIGGSNLGAFGRSKYFLAAVPFLLYLLEKKWKTAFLYAGAFLLAEGMECFLLGRTYGVLNFLVMAVCMVVTRMMPGFVMAAYMMSTTTVSSFMASMEKMHIPQAVTIPLAVTFRFFPTIGEEHGAISRAMDVRGVRFGGGKPMQMLEYRIIPLLMSCMNISDELSAAALTRGLGRPGKRTSIVELKFTWVDGLCFLLCAGAWMMFILDLLGR